MKVWVAMLTIRIKGLTAMGEYRKTRLIGVYDDYYVANHAAKYAEKTYKETQNKEGYDCYSDVQMLYMNETARIA